MTRKRCKPNHEEVKTRERNHVDGNLAEVAIEVARETKACGYTGHDRRDETVQIAIRWLGKFEGANANIVERLSKPSVVTVDDVTGS